MQCLLRSLPSLLVILFLVCQVEALPTLSDVRGGGVGGGSQFLQ
jgi:hypothetical protein